MHARLFLALWPDPALRAQLAARRDRWHWRRGAAPAASARLHLTLHFMGELPAERIEEVGAALQVPFTGFSLLLGRDVMWPHGVAVLEPECAHPALGALQLALAGRLRALALEPDARAYKPHVTLARRAAGTPLPPPARLDDAVRWQVEGYALMRAQPGYYEVLRAYGPH